MEYDKKGNLIKYFSIDGETFELEITQKDFIMKNKKVLVVYHNADMDGWFGGYLGKKFYQGDTLGINYDFNDVDILLQYKKIVAIDISFANDIIYKLLSNEIEIEIYDHHISRYNDLNGIKHSNYKYFYDVNKCGSLIFATINNILTPKLNNAFYYIDRYDRFDFPSNDPNDEHFAFTNGVFLSEWDPENEEIFDELILDLSTKSPKIIEQGRLITKYKKRQAMRIIKKPNIKIWEGYKFLFVNSENFSSFELLLVQDYLKEINTEYEALCSYWFNGEKWVYSLRSNSINVCDIAAEYGGGGHHAAAGFILDDLITN